MIPIDQQLACAKRELALRKSAYPGWIRAGRMSREKADQETEAMAAIVQTLETVKTLNDVGIAWAIAAPKKD